MAAKKVHFFMPQQKIKQCDHGCQQTIKDQFWGASKQLGKKRNIHPWATLRENLGR